MDKKIVKLFRKSSSSKKERINFLLDDVKNKLEEERNQAGGGILILQPHGKVIIVGDLHGDLNSLYMILSSTRFMQRLTRGEDLTLIFLGDYGDRGEYSPEVYYVLLYLKQRLPKNVLLLRGNHEGLPLIPFSPHNMPMQLQQKYNEHWKEIYTKMLDLFSNLHHSIIIEDKYLLLHGGAPNEVTSLEDISLADKIFPLTTYFEDILWSDPRDGINGVQVSPRGLGKLFGEDVTSKLLDLTGTKTLIRSHEPYNGVNVNHSGKVLTVFSRKGSPYSNTARAYLELDLTLEAKDAFTLAKEAIIF